MRKARENQVVIAFKVKPSFKHDMLAGFKALRVENQSDFFRVAIQEKLKRLGVDVDASANSRRGVGGRPTKYPTVAASSYEMNDEALSSATTQANQSHLGQLDNSASALPGAPAVPPVGESAPAKAPQSIYGRPSTTRKRRKKK